MRPLLLATVALGFAGAAHAQFAPIQPIEPPRNPYALPQLAIPRSGPPMGAIRPIAPIEEPSAGGFKPYKPYKPYAGVNPDQTPSGLYPEMHRHRKPKAPGLL